MGNEGHEQLVVVSDAGSGLRAIISIHDTTLGPACGGTRIWPYKSEQEAIWDALRLSQAMTYKSAAADLPLGGGKAVIIADPHTEKTEALVRAYGRFVDTLAGRYLTTTDVGTTGRDMEYVKQETDHVVGLPTTVGGSGDTSIMTGLGLYMGMKACAKEAWGADTLTGKTVAIQGFGKVASHTAHHLMKEDAKLVVTDVFDGALDRARDLGLKVVKPDEIYDVECDIFAPCALGAIINAETIPRLKCKLVAGASNNQLRDEQEDAARLGDKQILYAPDFVINAGGLMNVAKELEGYNQERALQQAEGIYGIMKRVLSRAKKDNIRTFRAANNLAMERIELVGQVRRTCTGR